MPEVGTEHTDVVTPTISHANNGFRCDLVGNSKPRSKGFPLIVDVSIEPVLAEAGDTDDTFLRIREAAVAFAVD